MCFEKSLKFPSLFSVKRRIRRISMVTVTKVSQRRKLDIFLDNLSMCNLSSFVKESVVILLSCIPVLP